MRALLAAMLDIDRERDFAPRGGDERIRDMAEIAGDQREQVARLRIRIAPNGEMPAGRRRVSGAFEIAVGEQNRRLGAIRFEPHPIS